jgi:hypothetical protein
MSETLSQAIQRYLEEMKLDVSEERVMNYIIREVHLGRRLSEVIQDAYVVNRVDENQLKRLLENKEIIMSVEEELDKAFKKKDFKFSE